MEEGYHYRPEAEGLPRICSEAVAAAIFEVTHREMREHRSVARLAADPSMLVYLIPGAVHGTGGGRRVRGSESGGGEVSGRRPERDPRGRSKGRHPGAAG